MRALFRIKLAGYHILYLSLTFRCKIVVHWTPLLYLRFNSFLRSQSIISQLFGYFFVKFSQSRINNITQIRYTFMLSWVPNLPAFLTVWRWRFIANLLLQSEILMLYLLMLIKTLWSFAYFSTCTLYIPVSKDLLYVYIWPKIIMLGFPFIVACVWTLTLNSCSNQKVLNALVAHDIFANTAYPCVSG